MEAWYKTELEKFLASCEADCPANLTEQEQQARQKMLTELFVEVNRDVVWEQDIK